MGWTLKIMRCPLFDDLRLVIYDTNVNKLSLSLSLSLSIYIYIYIYIFVKVDILFNNIVKNNDIIRGNKFLSLYNTMDT
jgi:hypothetical protein